MREDPFPFAGWGRWRTRMPGWLRRVGRLAGGGESQCRPASFPPEDAARSSRRYSRSAPVDRGRAARAHRALPGRPGVPSGRCGRPEILGRRVSRTMPPHLDCWFRQLVRHTPLHPIRSPVRAGVDSRQLRPNMGTPRRGYASPARISQSPLPVRSGPAACRKRAGVPRAKTSSK